MLQRLLAITGTVAILFGTGLAAQARQAQSSPAQTPTAGSPATTVNLEGCVYPKRAIEAGRLVAVPFGSVEDYMLTDTKFLSAAAGVDTSADQMFRLQKVGQDRLRELSGHKVGVTGRIQEKPDLSELQVTSIRQLVGACPEVLSNTHS